MAVFQARRVSWGTRRVILAPLVDIPLPEDRAAKFAPEELRRRQLAALTDLVLAGARSQAVVLAFEDLHWADPTSLDLMRVLGERGAQAPLLVVATGRTRLAAHLRQREGRLRPAGRGRIAGRGRRSRTG